MNVDSTTTKSELEGKVLPELQQIAQSMGVEGHQRLRKSDLIDAIVAKAASDGDGAAGKGGSEEPTAATQPPAESVEAGASAEGDGAAMAEDGRGGARAGGARTALARR